MDVARPDLKKRARRTRTIWIASLASVGMLVGIAAILVGPSLPVVRASDIVLGSVQKGELLLAVRGPGTLVPRQARWVVAQTDARVERVLVQPGGAVERDTVIVELSNPEVIAALQTAEAAYSAAKADHDAQMAQMRVDLLQLQSSLAAVNNQFEIAVVQEESERLGLDKGVISAIQYKRTAIDMAQLEIRRDLERRRVEQSQLFLQAQLQASNVRLDQLLRERDVRRQEAEALKLSAGMDGILQRISVEEGQQVNAGTNIARVAQPSSLMAEIRIAESQASQLQTGQAAKVLVGQSTLPGKVRRIDPGVENGVIVAEVDLLAPLPPGTRTDQSIEGTIEIDRIPDALFVARPVNALQGSEGTLFRVGKDGRAERVPVSYGKDSATEMQILGGLEAGDQVIVSDTSEFDALGALRVD